MTYVVKDACVKCKYMDCVEVCPVDCFYEGENMLVIHPAISDDSDESSKKWVEINRKYSEIWPNINKIGTPPDDRDDWKDVQGKFEKHFSEKPGKGS